MKRGAVLTLGLLAIIVLSSGSNLSAAPSGPTEADVAKSAAEEFEKLPEAAYQVDCRPNMKTFPPFTRFSGPFGSGAGFHLLADGRCFFDPSATNPPPKIEVIDPAAQSGVDPDP